MTKIGVLCSRVRVEEKMIFAALAERRVEYDRVDPRSVTLDLDGNGVVVAQVGIQAALLRISSAKRKVLQSKELTQLTMPGRLRS